ncbi:hypothetical protein QOT17_022286 [Balamuthia mandrillaris]
MEGEIDSREAMEEVLATAPAFARGLVSLLEPTLIECDLRIKAVFNSQRELNGQLDNLSAQLENFAQVSKTPHLSPYIQKLLTAKARMVVINSTLTNVQARLDKLLNEHASGLQSSKNTSSEPLFSSLLNKAKSFVDEPNVKARERYEGQARSREPTTSLAPPSSSTASATASTKADPPQEQGTEDKQAHTEKQIEEKKGEEEENKEEAAAAPQQKEEQSENKQVDNTANTTDTSEENSTASEQQA